MHLTQRDINIVKNYFADKPVLKAYLFGSYSRNEADENSDVDILVDLDYSTHIGLSFFAMQDELKAILKKNIDLISSNAVSSHFKPFIDRDKQLIYER